MTASDEIKKLKEELAQLNRAYNISNATHVHAISTKNSRNVDVESYNKLINYFEQEAVEYRNKIKIVEAKLILLGENPEGRY
jgi:endonuclease IV